MTTSGSPAARAAASVSSRATSSNDAGTVRTTLCSASGAGKLASHASRRWVSVRAEASTGETFATSGAVPQGRIAAVRSTAAWQSHDLEEATRRPGTRAPCSRAKSPTHQSRPVAHGGSRLPAGSSCAPAR